MNVALEREIKEWLHEELTNYATENEIYPVFWTLSLETKDEYIRKKLMLLHEQYKVLAFDHLSEMCLHIHLRKEGKEADKLLFLAPFWEEEKPMMKEVIKLLFKVLQSEIVTEYV